jgi:uracil-DNA glycosylase family 4
MSRMEALHARLVDCRRCPRLVDWREQVAREKRAAFADEEYWGRPVPGFGDPGAQLVIVGLAPAAHGANRTGRMFTGDRSGDFLYAALHRAGYASQPTSTRLGDGLVLTDCFITAPVKCAPPANKPLPSERDNCAPWLEAELALLDRARVFLCLGAIGWAAALRALGGPRAKFAHGAEAAAGPYMAVASFHVSQQNTFTGRLTPAMFAAILARCRTLTATRSKHEG